jgi:hypothetical protein
MYKIYENFITTEEQKMVLDFLMKNTKSLVANLRTYADFAIQPSNSIAYYYLPLSKFLDNESEILSIIRRAQNLTGVPYEDPKTFYGWAISVAPRGADCIAHKDVLDPNLLKTKKIVRMNILIQNATRGGNFDFFINDEWVTTKPLECCLLTFDASDIQHRITHNLGNKPRINLSIDAVVDR